MDRGKDVRMLCYALGPGFGHGMRTYALVRKLLQTQGAQVQASIAVYSQHLATLQKWVERDGLGSRVQLLGFSPGWDASDCGRAFIAAAKRLQPTSLVVDTFPRGLGLELHADFFRQLTAHKTLLNASLPRSYVTSTELHAFVDTLYDSVITPGEEGWYRQPSTTSHSPQASYFGTAPFLIASAAELPGRAQAAHWLQTDPNRPLILLIHAANWEESRVMESLYQEMLGQLPGRVDGNSLQVCLFKPSANDASSMVDSDDRPIMHVLPAADMVVGAAGYHLYHATKALQIPALLSPCQRRYDLQQTRASCRQLKEAKQVLMEWDRMFPPNQIETETRLHRPVPLFENGAEDAASYLLQRWSFLDDRREPASSIAASSH